MKLTSGFNFENYEITDYLGFCSGEYALNTKFLSDFNLLSSYSEKLEAAQKNALDLLISNAKQMGANAIIGLDIDYTTDDHDIMGRNRKRHCCNNKEHFERTCRSCKNKCYQL